MPSSSLFHYRAHPHLYEINTWAWLEDLSAKYKRQISLANVPAPEWDELARLGFDFVWLMGVWERSSASRNFFRTDPASFSGYDQALPGWKLTQIVGSPYSVHRYEPDSRIGAWADIDSARAQLRSRGIGLILDFVANHTAPDHPWIAAHPEYYVRADQDDLRRNPHDFILADSEVQSDSPTIIARGCDPYFPPWADTAQLNYFEPEARAELLGILRKISQHCDGVRCDMAMLVLNEIFGRTWGALLGKRKAPAQEFWSEAVQAVPGFIWLGEVYWNCEAPIQALGFQFTYDKSLYDALRDENVEEVRQKLSANLTAQSRCARFLENHDEARSAAVFGPQRREAAVTLLATLPGMRFYHQGQLDGRKIHLPIPLAFAAPQPPDSETRTFYERVLKLSNEDVFHSGEWRLLEVSSAGDESYGDFIAYEWCSPKKADLQSATKAGVRKIIAANLGKGTAQCRLRLEGISAGRQYTFRDELHDVNYPRAGDEIARSGLYIRLENYHAHIFDVQPA